MLKNLTASMIIVWSLALLLIFLGILFDKRLSFLSLMVLGTYFGSMADALE